MQSFYYANLARSKRAQWRKQFCLCHKSSSIDTIADWLGISTRQVKRYFAQADMYKCRTYHINWQFKKLTAEGRSKQEIMRLLHISQTEYYSLYWKFKEKQHTA